MSDQAAEAGDTQEAADRHPDHPIMQNDVPGGRHATKVAPHNSPLQELVAIFTMLLVFGCGFFALDTASPCLGRSTCYCRGAQVDLGGACPCLGQLLLFSDIWQQAWVGSATCLGIYVGLACTPLLASFCAQWSMGLLAQVCSRSGREWLRMQSIMHVRQHAIGAHVLWHLVHVPLVCLSNPHMQQYPFTIGSFSLPYILYPFCLLHCLC